jgi:hypothetical protein
MADIVDWVTKEDMKNKAQREHEAILDSAWKTMRKAQREARQWGADLLEDPTSEWYGKYIQVEEERKRKARELVDAYWALQESEYALLKQKLEVIRLGGTG